MPTDRICDFVGSEDLSALYTNREPLINSHCVKIAFYLSAVLLPLSLLLNDLIFLAFSNGDLNNESSWTFINTLHNYPQFIPTIIGSSLIGLTIIMWPLYSIRQNRSYPNKVRNVLLLGALYLVLSESTSFLLLGKGPTASSIGLAVVQISLFSILSKRLTSDLVPNLPRREDVELYLRNLRYIDRTILAIGIGFIFTILFTIAPTGSGLVERFTVVLLSGPIAIILLSIIGVGMLRIQWLQDSMLLSS